MAAAGWYPDPTGRFEFRYFDGADWTGSVSRAGEQFVDPPTAGPASPGAPWQSQSAGLPHNSGQPQHARQSAIPFSKMSSDERTGSRSTGLIVGLVVGVVALAGAVFLVTNSSSDEEERSSTNTLTVTDSTGLDDEVSEVTVSPEFVVDADSQPVTVQGTPLPPFDSSDNDAAVGQQAPTITGAGFDGTPVTIDGRQTGPVMVVFLAHWCPHCNAEIPRLLEWKASGLVPAQLQVIAVATAVSPASPNYPPAQWLDDRGWSWPVMADESDGDGAAGLAAQAFGATGWPYFVILGSDNQVLARHSGEIEVDDLQVLVENALAGDNTLPSSSPAPAEKPSVSVPAVPPTDLVVTPLRAGSGPGIEVGDEVTVHYVGVTVSDGEEFDSSYDRGEPATFTIGVGQLIEGWDVGLLGLQAGGRYQLDIPSSMAYGDDAAAQGRPAGALTFIVDIIAITPG